MSNSKYDEILGLIDQKNQWDSEVDFFVMLFLKAQER